jgi:hypothetical protein
VHFEVKCNFFGRRSNAQIQHAALVIREMKKKIDDEEAAYVGEFKNPR